MIHVTLKEVGQAVKDRRKSKKMNRKQCAKFIGIGERTLGTVESGKNTVSPDTYNIIANKLDFGFSLSFPLK